MVGLDAFESLDPMLEDETVTLTLTAKEWAVVGASLLLVERISFDEEPRLILEKIRSSIG